MYSDQELDNMIKRCRFPKSIQHGQRVEIRELYLEGKDKQAFDKLRKLLGSEQVIREKTLL